MDGICKHDGDVMRKFGGAIVCCDCDRIIGSWREPGIVLSMSPPAS